MGNALSGGSGPTPPSGASTVLSTTFDAIARYENFAGAAYQDVCPTPPFGSQVVKNFNASSTDTQAVLYYAGFPNNELILAFRGSSSPIDLDIDLDYVLTDPTLSGVDCSGCQVHRGFQTAYLSVSDEVRSAVKDAQQQYPLSSLTITGHSLGAGLASLASAEFAANGFLFNIYTYGEPRNGNPAWSNYIDSKLPFYNRVTHYNDGVPQIPPVVLGFQHHGTEYWISQESGNNASTTFNCGGGEHTICNPSTDYGAGPINSAHIIYLSLVSTPLYSPSCGYVFPT